MDEENRKLASDLSFAEFVRDQARDAGQVTFKKMFGEYAIYYDGKVVALVCDNQLFIKPTVRGRATIGDVVEASPFPGAKAYFLIGEQLDDRQCIARIIHDTASELPTPRPVKRKVKRKSSGD